MNALVSQFAVTVIFVLAVYFHIAKKNFSEAVLYGVQSMAVVILLVSSFLAQGSILLLIVALATLLVKAILAPTFFIRLVDRHQLKFTVSTYLNTPLTLVIIAVISGL